MVEREKWEWEREHSALTIEGQLENSRAFWRGMQQRRTVLGRIFLAGAIVLGVIAAFGIWQSI